MNSYQFPLTSATLYYDYLSYKDLKSWEKFFLNNPDLRFVGIDNPQAAPIESKKWIDRQMARYTTSGLGILGAYNQSNHQLVGNGGLIWRENILGEDVYEIGYSVIPAYWGKGIASEIAERFMEYFIRHELGYKVISTIAIENFASQRIAYKNGMTKGELFEFQGARCFQFYREFNR